MGKCVRAMECSDDECIASPSENGWRIEGDDVREYCMVKNAEDERSESPLARQARNGSGMDNHLSDHR